MGVSAGISDSVPWVAMAMRSFLSLLGRWGQQQTQRHQQAGETGRRPGGRQCKKRCHRCQRCCDPSELDAQTGPEDISALAVIDIALLGLGRNVCCMPCLPDFPSNCFIGRFGINWQRRYSYASESVFKCHETFLIRRYSRCSRCSGCNRADLGYNVRFFGQYSER